MYLTRRTVLPLPPPSSADWRNAVAAGDWGTLSTKLEDVDPADDASVNPNTPPDTTLWGNQRNVLDAWGGGAWDATNKRFYVFGGGHGDYYGNEVYALDLDVASPAWQRLIDPTGAQGNEGTGPQSDWLDDDNDINGGSTNGVYLIDDRPRSSHTYFHIQCRNGDMYVLPIGGVSGPTGVLSNQCFRFNRSTNDWSTLTNRSAGNQWGSTCYDSGRDCFWHTPSDNAPFQRYNPGTDTWVQQSFTETGWSGYPLIQYDSIADAVIILQTDLTNGIGYFDIAEVEAKTGNPALQPTDITTTGTGPSWLEARGGFSVRDTGRDCYYVYDGGSDIFKLEPPTSGGRLTGTWTWSTISGSGTTPVGQASNGTYGRFWFDEEWDICGVVNDVTENFYFRNMGDVT